MNAAPAPRPPADEALEILRRLEPVLKDIQAEQKRQAESMAELRGKVSSLPTIWQIVPAILAINAGIVALAFGLVAVVRGG